MAGVDLVEQYLAEEPTRGDGLPPILDRMGESNGRIGAERRRLMPDISQRMLTLDLRALEDAGLVTRTVHPEVPAKVEYGLTEAGARLRHVVDLMGEFAEWLAAHRQQKKAAA